MGARMCACKCGEVLPSDADPRRRFVNDTHRNRQHARDKRRLKRDKTKALAATTKDRRVGRTAPKSEVSRKQAAVTRKGREYKRFAAGPYPQLIARGESTQAQVARALDITEATVSRWMSAWIYGQAEGEARESWEQSDETASALMSYEPFVRRFHPHVLLPGFHLEWERELDKVVGRGGRAVLLAPQRHGKTEFLIRYCQRRIAANPDICILWVSRSKELAEQPVGMLRQLLEEDEFAEAVLGPGESYQPGGRSGKSWTDGEFTVANRTRVRKSPTVTALGIGGSVSGRDVDLMIVDDPQEREDCDSPTTREKQYRWFVTTLLARKEEMTGVCLITSRRHIEDIPGKLARDHEDWRTLTYQAHDPACPIPATEPDEHTDCVLWPEFRTYRFLMQKRADDPAFFECNYQNHPRADTRVLISAEDIDRCKDHDRRAGDVPRGISQLIAGIDPADAKPVAGVLWGYEHSDDHKRTGRRHLIDYLEASPGIRGGREIIKSWHQRFGVTRFVVEKNMAQSWWLDTEIADYRARNGIEVIQHYTSASSKWDARQGVTAMFELFKALPEGVPTVTLPWGDAETRQRMERYIRSLIVFDPDFLGNKHADDDLVMASWFPQSRLDNINLDAVQNAIVDYPQTAYAWRTAYPTRTLEAV